MKKLESKGITLVALIITIIILLILAGITISQLTQSGLFENAKLAKERYENAEKLQNQTLEEYKNGIDEYINNDRSVAPKSTLLYPATEDGEAAGTANVTYNLNYTYKNYEYLLVEAECSAGYNGTVTMLIPTKSIVEKDSYSTGGSHSNWSMWVASGSIWWNFNSERSFYIGQSYNSAGICHIYGIN